MEALLKPTPRELERDAAPALNLLRVFPDQVGQNWPVIDGLVRKELESLGPVDAPWVLECLFIDLCYERKKLFWLMSGNTAVGALVIHTAVDALGRGKVLTVDTLHMSRLFTPGQARAALHWLKAIAEEEGCLCITGITANSTLISIFESLGADTSQRVVTLEV